MRSYELGMMNGLLASGFWLLAALDNVESSNFG